MTTLCCQKPNYETPWGLCHALDHIRWKIEATCSTKIDREFIRLTGFDRDVCDLFFKHQESSFTKEDADHIRDNIFRLNQKISGLIAFEDRVLKKALELLQKKDEMGFKRTIEELPLPVQHQLFQKHWQMMGEPSETSEDSHLRSIAHHDFGKVSLLGLESRCAVSDEQRIKTLENFLQAEP